MNYLKLISFFTFLLFAPSWQYAQGNRLHVRSSNTTGIGDGKSWQTAFSDLQQALLSSKAGDSIWIARGTYYPTSGTDRNISFSIPNGVKVFGGFRGAEISLKERDWQANPSVLSGDIGLKNDITDNTLHVVLFTNTDSTTSINGLWIENGRTNDGTSINDENASGSGALIISTDVEKKNNPTIENCIFQNNIARFGGGISIRTDRIMGNLKINNCKFQNNIASSNGGAICWVSSDLNGHIFLDNCSFESNSSVDGGAIMFSALFGNLSIRNSTFEANESTYGAGGIVIAGDASLDGCTFTNNSSIFAPIIGFYTPIRAEKPGKTTVTIKKTSFISTNAGFHGGAIMIHSYQDEVVDLSIQQSIFKNNRTNLGAQVINIVNGSGSGKISFQIEQCTFERNYISDVWSHPYYGMINIINTAKSTGAVTGVISNCTFFKNDRPINIEQDSLAPTKLSILNSTFIGNGSGTIIKHDRNPSQQAEVHLQNNIFYDEAPALSSMFQSTLRPNLSGFYFNHNLFSAPSCKTTTDTLGCGIGNIFGQYPKFVDSSSVSGLKLAPGSIAINAGRWHPDLPTLDLSGQPRVQDCKVDLGAYESPSILPAKDSLSAKAQIRSTPINQALGEIGIQQITGGFPPYRLLWENGDTVRTRRNLTAGTYTLTLSDQQGCFNNYRFVVPFTTGVRDRVAQGAINLAPNPVPTGQSIKLFYQDIEPGNWELQLLDLTGKQLRNSRINLSNQGEIPIPLDVLPKGIYLLNLSKDSHFFNQKFVVQ